MTDSGQKMHSRGQTGADMCGKRERERECACMTFGNIVILIPRQGLSLGLHQDYSSRPIITRETEGEAQCQASDQQPKRDVTSMQ